MRATQTNGPFKENAVKALGGVFSSPRGENYSPNNSKPASKVKGPLFGIFKPGSPSKQGYNKTLNPLPQYVEEVENPREHPSTMREKIQTKQKEEKIWIPNNFGYSKPSESIVRNKKNKNE